MKLLCALALGGMAMVMAGPASATTGCNKQLFFISSDTGVIAWQSPRFDSPRDPNSSRLAVHVLRQDGDDYAIAYSKCSGAENRLVGQLRNLSFEFLNQTGEPSVHIGNGAPRYSVDIDQFGDGSYNFSAFLSGFHCNEPMAENTQWSRADFTGRLLAGCSIFVNNVQYTSDGVKSAWRLYADANPTDKVIGIGPAYLVFDEDGFDPNTQDQDGATAFVDRLAFHNIMYVASGTGSAAVKTCPNESSC